MLQCFIWVLHMFHTYVASVLSRCFICFTLMFQVFHPDVAYVFNTCFPRVSDICCKCFNCFGRMLQMFFLHIAKVDLVLHMLQWTPSAATTFCGYWARLHACGCGGGTSGRRGKPCRHKSKRSGHGTQSGVGPT